MTRYFRIAINLPQVDDYYDYHLPDEWADIKLPQGALVLVPFGKQIVQGVILEEIEQPSISETRPIAQIIENEPVLTSYFVKLMREMSSVTYIPISQWLGLFLPAGIEQQSNWTYELNPEKTPANLNSTQQKIVMLLQQRGSLRKQQFEKTLHYSNWQKELQQLVRSKVVLAHPSLRPPTVKPHYQRLARLTIPPDAIDSFVELHNSRHSQSWERRKKGLIFLAQEGKPIYLPWIYAESGTTAADLKKLEQLGAIQFQSELAWRDPLAGKEVNSEPFFNLTPDQAECWNVIQSSLHRAWNGEKVKPILLHGITGSGKTELYLRAVAETIDHGRQAIVLVPEISLTVQTIQRFQSRFGERVGVQHSRLSPGEQFDTWQRIRAGLISVLIGPRSALFMPFSKPGLVVIDECHDDSYYQESQPNYHSIDLALRYMEISQGLGLLGSATPTVEQCYIAQNGEWQYLHLPKRIMSRSEPPEYEKNNPVPSKCSIQPQREGMLPDVYVVDMRSEIRVGNRSIFSQVLQNKLAQTLAARQQAILFLNRRGMATYVFCRECGAVLKCPRCNIPLTYHQSEEGRTLGDSLICHQCGYHRQMPKRCPQCGSTQIRQFGTGTEKVVAEVERLFPQARCIRWDWDTTRSRGAHEAILNRFARHQADVLIGTQMLAKGLDLPSVTLVGIILAEVGLNLPDFRATERTFQLLTQVAGRAGRGDQKGQVILQTYQPEHYVIKNAAEQNYEGFYQHELELRKIIQYPPFTQIVRLEYRNPELREVEEETRQMADEIRSWIEKESIQSIRLVGPLPCFFQRIKGDYRWQIVLIGEKPQRFLQNYRSKNGWRFEINPISLL